MARKYIELNCAQINYVQGFVAAGISYQQEMDHQIFMSRTQRRTLQSYTSGTYSLISGNASDTFHAEETVELIATTHDATNNLQTSGGDILI